MIVIETAYNLQCVSCENTFEATSIYKCPLCKGILRVEYSTGTLYEIGKTDSNTLKQRLIFHDGKTSNLLGEGDTPLIQLPRSAENFNLKKLYGKCEFSNPSSSFKDRPVAAGIKKAIDFGYTKVVTASSGNGAAAVAAYSARFNLESIILVPENIPNEKVKQAQFFGSKVIKVKGPYSNSYDLASQMSDLGELCNLTTTFINPYTLEGDKGVAFELQDQLDSWPDYIVVPIGAGPLLVGIVKGYQEMNQIFKLGREMPRMIGVQATGCSPISQAFKSENIQVFPEMEPKTIAGGIGDGLNGYTEDGTYTLEVIRSTNGICLDVSDHEILDSQKELAINEGVFVEPSSAAAYAAIKKLHFNGNQELIDKTVVLLLTGHGLKDLKNMLTVEEEIPCIPPDIEELRRVL